MSESGPAVHRPRRALVSGGSGFVGRRLCAALRAQGWDVTSVHRRACSGPWSDAVEADLGTAPLPAAAIKGCEVVFHLAGYAHAIEQTGDEAVHRHATVDATRNLLASCTDADIRHVVFVSTVKAVADPGVQIVDESWTEPPKTAYGRAKRAAEAMVLEWGQAAGRHAVVLRPPLLMGGEARGNLRRMFEAIRRRRFPPLPDFHNRRSLLHVDDLVDALLCVHAHPATAGQTYFVSYPHAYSTREMVNTMRAALGRAPQRFALPRALWAALACGGDLLTAILRRRAPFDSQHLARLAESACYDAGRLRQATGFIATRSLAQALDDMGPAQVTPR